MKKFITVFVLISIVLAGEIPINLIPHIGKIEDVITPRYEISLDDEPYHRWDDIVPVFKPAIQKFVKLLDLIKIPATAYNSLALFAQTQSSYKEFVQELKGIGEIAEVDWKKLLLANFLYDISSILPHANFCSSIIAIQEDGTCIHGRNLDFFPWSLFSKDSAYIEVYQGGKHIATFHQLIGAVMVLSGTREGQFSVTVDTRKYLNSDGQDAGINALIDNIMIHKYVPSTFLTRNVLQTEGITFETAREAFLNTSTTAPIYYIVAGINSGITIEKDPVEYKQYFQIGENSNLSDGEWYYVQTNYDRYENPGLDDRVTPACKRLNEIGQKNINLEVLHSGVMAQYPNLNIASIYTSMFNPSQKKNNLTLLYGNIKNLKTPDDLMDTDIMVENDYVRQLVLEGWTLPEEQIQEAIEYLEVVHQQLNLDEVEKILNFQAEI